DNMSKFGEISEQAKIKHFVSPSTMSLLVVDGTEVLMNIPSWQARNQSLWSDLTAYVETMLHMFDDYWDRGEPVNDVISRLSSQQSYMELLADIQNTLSEKEWVVESPGILEGNSGQKHTFNLVAYSSKLPEEKLAIDLREEENPLGQITRMGAKKFDLRNVTIALVSESPVAEEGESLAKLYGISLVSKPEVEGFIQEIQK
ncbi:MAG: hypothetical protein ACXADO_06530, partial [Candidatus Thorarchaeota archaeon]